MIRKSCFEYKITVQTILSPGVSSNEEDCDLKSKFSISLPVQKNVSLHEALAVVSSDFVLSETFPILLELNNKAKQKINVIADINLIILIKKKLH
ncbi:MAG: hypothetical protein A2275_00165 [Bacteroidetes bacterium RIFOXYA12_FULL_35_11]|nr:MAG: hypothetical protein A2275_00165 [Bacteroidetes bacterium RIFOXYA12_FULL_35_11]